MVRGSADELEWLEVQNVSKYLRLISNLAASPTRYQITFFSFTLSKKRKRKKLQGPGICGVWMTAGPRKATREMREIARNIWVIIIIPVASQPQCHGVWECQVYVLGAK